MNLSLHFTDKLRKLRNPVLGRKLTKFQNYFIRALATLIVIVVISCSMKIDSVVQPSDINAGDTFTSTLDVTIQADVSQTSRFMVAVLVPKVWRARQRASVSFTSSVSTGVQAMTVIPVGQAAPQANGLDWPTNLATKIGNGGNLINDWEWVAFYSNRDYAVSNGATTAKVTINIPTTADNISFKIAYCVANSNDGLSGTDYYNAVFPGCVEVHGAGDLVDFCNPQLASVEPRNALDNDIITVNFDGGVVSNKLDNVNDIYFCAKGFTATGDSITVCNATAGSKLAALGASRYRIDLWPRQYFSLTDNQRLTRIEYYFTDVTGVTRVGYGGSDDPFIFSFNCP